MSDSLRGHYLVAGKRLRDRNFFRTVVLIVEHNSQGAMGLVVNRPSTVTVAHALSQHFDLPETDDLVYVGGPVEPSELFIIHNSPQMDQQEAPIVPGLFVGNSPDIFERVIETSISGDPDLKFRIFSGCAGWAPGQLEGELSRGDWYHHPASVDSVFDEDPYAVWDLLMNKVSEACRILPHPPGNPEWN